MILGTEETRAFSSYNDQKALIQKLEDTIAYSEVKKNDLLTGEVIDCPIIRQSFETAPIPEIKSGISYPRLESNKSFAVTKGIDEQMLEAMDATRLVLGVPTNKNFAPMPLAITAMPSLVAQAIGGKSSILCQTEEKNNSRNMKAEIKSAIINECLSLRKDDCKIYQCDGMVRYVAGSNYKYLPISELLETLESGLSKAFAGFTYMMGSVSHQYVEFSFMLNDVKLEKEVNDMLSQAGVMGNYTPGLIFSTSNTGDSGANLFPILYGGLRGNIVIETPLKLEHTGNATIEKFAENVDKIAALIKGAPDKLEALVDVPVKHPAIAFRNAACKGNLPLASFAEQAGIFEATYGNLATALDLYFELINCFTAYANQTQMDPLRRMKLMNGLAKVFLDINKSITEVDTDVDLTIYNSAA